MSPSQDPWAEFDDAPKVRRTRQAPKPAKAPVHDQWAEFGDAPKPTNAAPRPTGEVYDGDTFRLTSGQNARLAGVDAFELSQTGRSPTGDALALGHEARDALAPYAQPDGAVALTGAATYGRPVATLENGGDAGQALLSQGLALAAPEYLRSDPTRLNQYMEAERLARLNRLGAHGNTYQLPKSFRAGNPDPWAKPEPGVYGEGAQAIFWDEPTPFQGLRPEIEQGYLNIWQDLNSKPEDLVSFAQANGFTIDAEQTRKRYADRNRTRKAGGKVTYATPLRVLTDPGDGTLGAAVRGVADPINMLDEVGDVGLAVLLACKGRPGLVAPREDGTLVIAVPPIGVHGPCCGLHDVEAATNVVLALILVRCSSGCSLAHLGNEPAPKPVLEQLMPADLFVLMRAPHRSHREAPPKRGYGRRHCLSKRSSSGTVREHPRTS